MAWTTPKTWTAVVVPVSDFNTHIRDNLNMLAFQASGAWVPTLSVPVGSGLAAGLGDGTLSGQYIRVGQIVTFQLELVWGTSTTVGAGGQFKFSLPFTCTSGTTRLVGTSLLFDASSGNSVEGLVDAVSSGTDMSNFYAPSVAGALTAVDGTHPWTWDEGDIIRVSGSYLAA